MVALGATQELEEIKKSLLLETQKQEALTLALQLMDRTIEDAKIKEEIAHLLSEYIQNATVWEFLENRLLTTVVPKDFDPSLASNVCQSLQLYQVAQLYQTLQNQTSHIQIFRTAWAKAAQHQLKDAEKTDAAFSLLTQSGFAKAFVQSIADGDKKRWDQAALDAALLLQREGLDTQALRFFVQLKADLGETFGARFKGTENRSNHTASDDR